MDSAVLDTAFDLSLVVAHDFGRLTEEAKVQRTVAALEANNIGVVRVADAVAARQAVVDLIPAGAQVYQAASQTLDESGITSAVETSDRFVAVRPRLWGMDRATQADEIRRLGAAPDVMLGSANAVTETGSLVIASATGSQLGPYVSGAGQVVLVVGTQKIVPNLDAAFQRLDTYVYPRVDAIVQATYGVNTSINKVLITHREYAPGRVTVILVDETLGI